MVSTHSWHALESDPDLWRSYVEQLGVRANSLDFVEIYSLDNSDQPDVPIFAYIFLYPHGVSSRFPASDSSQADTDDNVWTIKQIPELDSCCGLIALLHAIGNNRDLVTFDPASPLAQFFEKTQMMTPEERGTALLNNKTIHRVHEEIAQQGQTAVVESGKVGYHYVAYVVLNGSKFYELNGGAKEHQERFIECLGNATFFTRVCHQVKEKVKALSGDIRFNLIGLARK
ncbi:unnamed protein product [Didymodactylos carnosus]|uniref:Ubiquitin carboxyl-terminal hydrolase n=1 Tax=Didymodactylos carnosus TaxID=1234261 RepID=A0A813Z943_9BILA|nr:unnamed protein product [Didymodactylos carnosus]CAF0896032.1 unnamed protein product [Didymodactylos carnosus]CAF3514481.1 unnamed protein product [Didymodactylos carnosus]CAF3679376.1 unnamed protein product [Didymodactylos carnosus]